ncbi:MAG: biopolymer transporter ExbD [Crocinitomicaceae bacterium]|nr:biopolymer transporter ExbD [Crocinitomicaceae bacterium]|tara:strand:+ start:39765 stop:40235 length:471 start_codon:yes stop_codon:yes gene_type:complete
MSKFKKSGSKALPAVSTASLPDIVFMLLFFFMVTTVMREVDLKVKMNQPEATEIKKLENKSLVTYIYIGEPSDTKLHGTTPRIQLNDAFANVEDVAGHIEEKRHNTLEALIPKLTTSLKVDRNTQMGIVTKVKQELREVNALKISYSTLEKVEKDL